MIKMHVDIHICDGLHVPESLPERHESLSFEEYSNPCFCVRQQSYQSLHSCLKIDNFVDW